MNKKSIASIIITILLAVIAAALTIIVLEKAGIIACKKDVSSNTAHFHRGEESVPAHVHSAECSHGHKHEAAKNDEHKHDEKCASEHKHETHKHDEHKHDAKCSGNHDHAEHNHKH